MVRKIGPSAWMAKIDFKSAFKHVIVRPSQWHLLGMHLNNDRGRREFYFDATLPFGLRSSPTIFNKFTQAFVYMIKQRITENIFGYLDDYFIVADSKAQCDSDRKQLKILAAELGWKLNDEKERGPLQVMELLGIEIDAPKQVLRVSHQRLLDTAALVKSWVRRKSAPKREIASLSAS